MGDEYVKTDFVNLSGRFVMPVLVYDRYKVKFDDEIYSRLPHEFKAFSEDDFKSVGIVIQLDYSRIDAGKYSDGAQAFVVACELLIYDIGNKTYAVESFVGDPPPESRMSKSGGGIPIPKERIMEYIMKLIKN